MAMHSKTILRSINKLFLQINLSKPLQYTQDLRPIKSVITETWVGRGEENILVKRTGEKEMPNKMVDVHSHGSMTL